MSKVIAKAREKPAANSTAAQATNCLENDSIKSYLNGLKPKDIPVDDIFGFRNHSFVIHEDDHAMAELKGSIQKLLRVWKYSVVCTEANANPDALVAQETIKGDN